MQNVLSSVLVHQDYKPLQFDGTVLFTVCYEKAMQPQINYGDIILIRHADTIIYGNIYLIELNGCKLIRKIMKSDNENKILCVALNNEYDSQEFDTLNILNIYKIIGSFHSF